MRAPEMPVALTIAGSDSGGEAGIQADLAAFHAFKVHGTCAVTCLTAQRRAGVFRIEPCPPKMVRAQLEAVAGEWPLAAAKTGMLHSAAIVREVAGFFRAGRRPFLVVDPVLISTSGRRLLEERAVAVLQRELLPLAGLATPNVPEAEALLGVKIKTIDDARWAAREFHRRFGCAAIVKGGHLPGAGPAADFLHTADGEWLLQAPRRKGVKLHGTGCAFSAAVTAAVARGHALPKAVERAKVFISRRIQLHA